MRPCERASRALSAQNRQVSMYPCVPPRVCSGEESMASDKTDTSLFPLAKSNMLAFRRAPDPELDSVRMDPAYRAAKQAADWRDEMLDKNSRTVVGRLIWQMGVTAALALSLLAVLALGKRVYMLEEALTVMLLIAISVAVILILLVVFVLFQAGIRQVFLWLRAGIVRLARLTNGQVPPPDSIIPPSMPR
jgi:hypothetical protein